MKPRYTILLAVLIVLLAVAYTVQAREAEPAQDENSNLTRKIVSPVKATETPQPARHDEQSQPAQTAPKACIIVTQEVPMCEWGIKSCSRPTPIVPPECQPTPGPEGEWPYP